MNWHYFVLAFVCLWIAISIWMASRCGDCPHCGGDLEEHINGHFYCECCGHRAD